jgi:CRISPR-associated protein Csb2
MVFVRLEFPLGVYYALGPRERGEADVASSAEWAPSPVRLIGALLAAAHESPSDDVDADRSVLERLCRERPPLIHAPVAVAAHEQRKQAGDFGAVAELRGPSRWAPRNPSRSELKEMSPRVVGWTRTEVDKNGIAIGNRPIGIEWPDLDLTGEDLGRLRRMASDVAWLGTSRSPVLITVHDERTLDGPVGSTAHWTPLPWDTTALDASVRVPGPDLLAQYDAAYATRRSAKGRVESSGQQRPAAAGNLWPYAFEARAPTGVAPEHWGRLTVLVLDEESEMVPRTPATYLVARAFRAALMDTFGETGGGDDAPAILHGHGDTPHLAILPLPLVGHEHSTGDIRGFGLLFPHSSRIPDVSDHERNIARALDEFLPGATERRRIRVPGAGSLLVRAVSQWGDRLWALSPARYVGPSRSWVTVTPVVHSRWQKRNRPGALADQVAADCAHVGLPEPASMEFLRTSAVPGGASRLTPPVANLPEEWRRSLQGPQSHLRLEFEQEVYGPVVLGRARHFGVGLCIPDSED